MNADQMKGSWKQLKGKVKEQWGKLTDDDLTVINGQQEQLVGKLQEHTATPKSKPKRNLSVIARRGDPRPGKCRSTPVFADLHQHRAQSQWSGGWKAAAPFSRAFF